MLLLLQHSLIVLLPFAQAASAAAGPSFDVVSVKPASPNRPGGRIVVGMTGREGGPGTGDPGRVRYAVVSLKYVVIEAYREQGLRIDAPGWLDDDWFQIDATMPADTTEAQFRAMMQHLLADRFQMTYHRDTKEVSAFHLVVGKGGPKMKASAEPPPNQEPVRQRLITGSEKVDMTLHNTSMERLASILSGQLGGPVTDATGLTGQYDFSLTFSKGGADTAALPDLFTAVQSQLGLRLEAKKESIAVMVVDHMERVPREN